MLATFYAFLCKIVLFPLNLCSLPYEHRFPPLMNISGKANEHKFKKTRSIKSHLRAINVPSIKGENWQKDTKGDIWKSKGILKKSSYPLLAVFLP